MSKETVEIINQIVDVLDMVKNNVGNLTKAVKLMDKNLDSLQAENEKQYLMINTDKIKIVYNGKYTNKTMIQIDGLSYPIEIRESYEEIKSKLRRN